MKERKPIGEVTHYYAKIKVAVIKFNKKVEAGTKVHFKGATTDFDQKIDSIHLDHKEVDAAKKGKEVGIKVKNRVRIGDEVYEA